MTEPTTEERAEWQRLSVDELQALAVCEDRAQSEIARDKNEAMSLVNGSYIAQQAETVDDWSDQSPVKAHAVAWKTEHVASQGHKDTLKTTRAP